MTIRAKFIVSRKTQIGSVGVDETNEVELMPVVTGSEENESFYKYTPGGSIKLALASKATADALELGSAYYVDFTKAEE